jgi:SAM-dependent methyltransferase
VVVSGPGADGAARSQAPTAARVIWHDLECGGYRADLPLWRELAARAGGPVLDVGAGTGRVSLDLAGAGEVVTALDIDALLLAALSARAARSGLSVATACADARVFSLRRRDFAICLVPMQTIQLLGGSGGRIAFLLRAREHLRPGATIACAILSSLEPFDCARGSEGPPAERAQVDGLLYVSRARRVSVLTDKVEIERERRVLSERPDASPAAPRGERGPARDIVQLDRLSAAQLERDARGAGLRPLGRLEVAPTQEHVGSVVVVLGA